MMRKHLFTRQPQLNYDVTRNVYFYSYEMTLKQIKPFKNNDIIKNELFFESLQLI